MSNRQLALNTLKSTINYELHKDPDKIRELQCEKSTNYIIKKFVHLRNDLKTVINAVNKIFYNSGYSPYITRDNIDPTEPLYRGTEYNVNIQWPNQYNRTHMCTIKAYYHYKADFVTSPRISKKYLDICITIQIGVLYDPDYVLNMDFPDTSENICGFMFINKYPKLHQDMTCNVNLMMVKPKKYKIPRYLQDLITELHYVFDISNGL
jgi:hypothetical protein